MNRGAVRWGSADDILAFGFGRSGTTGEVRASDVGRHAGGHLKQLWRSAGVVGGHDLGRHAVVLSSAHGRQLVRPRRRERRRSQALRRSDRLEQCRQLLGRAPAPFAVTAT